MTVADVWYALFRHKWKIVLLSLLGVGAAGFLYIKNKPPYVSEAKLLVRYVVDSRSSEVLGPDGQVKTPPNTAESIINSEAEILRSLDLCRQVAEAITPARILPPSATETNSVAAAAAAIYESLNIDIPKKSSVIGVSMSHPDPEVAQLVLQKLIEFYIKRHAEIHRGLGTMDAVLAQQTDQVRSRLMQTDQELQDLRTKAGVLSLEDSRRGITEQMNLIRQQIFAVEAELAEYQMLIKSPAAGGAPGTNSAAAANPNRSASAPSDAARQTASASIQVLPPPVAQPAAGSAVATPAPVVNSHTEEYRKGLTARLEALRSQERDLRELRAKAGPAGTDDGKHSYTEQIGRVHELILTAEKELTQYSTPPDPSTPEKPASLAAGTNVSAPGIVPSGSVVMSTNPTAVLSANKPAPGSASSGPVAPESYAEYKALLARLELLHRQELEYRNVYTDGNSRLVRVRQQVAEAEASRRRIEAENPVFLTYGNPQAGGSAPASAASSPLTVAAGQVVDPSRIRALEAKLKVLYVQLDKQKQEASALEQFETQLNQLQRKKELDEKNYRHFAAGLEQTRFDEALGSGKLANISIVQAPSPSMLSKGKRMKISGLVLGVGIAAGIGLALLIELMLDHTVRRSVQLETSFALPLLSTIPRTSMAALKPRLQLANGDDLGLDRSAGSPPVIPGWSAGHPLREHIEALRDRTLMHFEGDLRKPKLIGVTGCREGAGVTTIACGLAAALSEAADGRVLLINMDTGSQSLHPFMLGHEACSLVDVVDAGKRETALVGNNLYMATNRSEGNGGNAMLPTSIARILPKIKMSDYDYVVFDMPTVSPTSISGKLAGMVDLVFMVVESEKDSQNSLKRACQLLADNNAAFRIVLNKFERYVPKWLDQET